MKKKVSNKFITVLAAMALAFAIAGIQTWDQPAFAEEDKAALDVYADDQRIASFSMAELEQIAKDEGSRSYTFSCFNTYPTPATFKDVEGPTVEGVLEAALGQPDLDSIEGGQLITFSANDGVEESFLKEQLFADRYYYPDFEKIVEKSGQRTVGYRGKAVQTEAMQGAVKVPAVISLKEDGNSYGEGGNYDVGRLLFGQISPSEQNHSVFVKQLATGDYPEGLSRARGRITVWSLDKKPTETWNALTPSGSEEAVFTGDQITFDRSVNASHTEGGSRYWIHYTLDGTDPARTSQMYNFNNNSFGAPSEKINKPQVAAPGPMTIRTIVTGYGKRDSEISNLVYRGYDPVDVTIAGNSGSLTYDGQTHTVTGYEVTSGADLAEVSLAPSMQAEVSAADAGEYPMGLEESSFDIQLKEASETSRPRVTIRDGSLTIQKAPLQVVTQNGKKVFDGKALTAPGQIIGLIGEESATLEMVGSQTEIGSSQNTYQILWDGSAKAGNYQVTDQIGTLTVTKPTLARPAIKSLKVKGKAITIKWGKVSGASGYEVWRAVKKSGKYSRVKTIKSGRTLTFKNTKLKKKKTYYYKIRAYKSVAGEKFYSSFSAVKYKKVK